VECLDLKTLSLYQDGSLDESQSENIREHLLECEECAQSLRTLGRTGLFFRIELGSHKNGECPGEEEIGAYVGGEMAAADRVRIEAHLLNCSKCLHEVALLSEPAMAAPDESAPDADAKALERFKALADGPARVGSPRRTWRAVLGWGLPAAAAASVLVALTAGWMWPGKATKTDPAAAPVASKAAHPPARVSSPLLMPIAGPVASRNVGPAAHEFAATADEVLLSSDVSALQPDTTDLAQFAREMGLILREVERISKRPAFEDLELVQEDIGNSGLAHTVASLKENVGDSQGRKFLADCEYVLMRLVQVERDTLDRDLTSLVGEIKRLNLTETARLMELERGRSRWLAGL
jgi:anti-sigma factor RsiW